MTGGGLITLEEIRAAHERIRESIERTPLVAMRNGSVMLKAENLQPVGSFKLRGALNTMLALTTQERERGVVAHSSGNHAIAVAHAGAVLGVAVTVVMPSNAPIVKLNRTMALGARVIEVGPGSDERLRRAAEFADQEGLVPIEPYDSRAIIAATATIAIEILEDLAPGPGPAIVIYVPVSGGGLAGGVAAGAKAIDPAVRIVGVEPDVAADYLASRRAGTPVAFTAEQMSRTAADGLRVTPVGALPWMHLEAFVDDIVTVTEDEIDAAAGQVLAETDLVAEPSGAVSVAAALRHASVGPPARRVAVLTGGNTDVRPKPPNAKR